jgi:undecaprenyl-diphosphatase
VIRSVADEPARRVVESATDPLLAGAVAMLGIAGSFVERLVTRRLAAFLALYALVASITSGEPALGLLVDIGVGVFVGSATLLLFGRHDLTPDAREVATSLASIGIRLTSIDRLGSEERGLARWTGTTETGERVVVKAVGRDERSADVLVRVYRWVRFRKTGDHRPFVSVRRSIEREALVALQAAALGIRTPRVVGVAEAGLDGMVLAREAVAGVPADQVADIADDTLIAVWTLVNDLHDRRIAHRDLRLANIVLDGDGEPWLLDFRFSELAASDQLIETDVAELLASTAASVGPERAVAAAHRTTGPARLGRALPWLQPPALTRATRDAIGGDEGLADLRALLVEQPGITAEEPVDLERISGKQVFVLVTIGLSAWFLIPQFADIENVWRQTRGASAPWVAAAAGFSVLTYFAATASLLGAIPARLRYWPALAAQVASSFANRITPAKVGGYATNIRYFQRQGVPTAVGVTAVGVNAIAGVVVHVILTIGFLFVASDADETSGLTLPSTGVIVVASAIVAVVGIGSVAVPVVRRLVVTHVLPQARSGWAAITALGRSPGRLVLLFGGSAAITMSYVLAMFASLEAFGSSAPFPLVALLFLTGSVVANAAPTPGGLGAAEAALVAALSTIEETAIVIPAVFLFRLVTFWLPILPGWVALTYLRQTDRI